MLLTQMGWGSQQIQLFQKVTPVLCQRAKVLPQHASLIPRLVVRSWWLVLKWNIKGILHTLNWHVSFQLPLPVESCPMPWWVHTPRSYFSSTGSKPAQRGGLKYLMEFQCRLLKKCSSGVSFSFILLGLNVIFNQLKQKMITKLNSKLQMMNNCVLYTSKRFISKMNKSTLGTKAPNIDIPQLGHGFTSALCLGALEGNLFLKIHIIIIGFIVWCGWLQWQLIKILILHISL